MANEAHPFVNLVTLEKVTLHFGDAPGVEHPDCAYRAEVVPDLDAYHCRHCGRGGRISGAWFMDLLTARNDGQKAIDG